MRISPHILLVEDDQGIRDLLTEFLEAEGFHCDVAMDGSEAARRLGGQHYDLLITDFRMPKMDGVELLEWCLQNNLSMPVIFLSADFLVPHERLLISKLNPMLLSKPICLEHFLNSIHACLKNYAAGKCPA